ncbi:hypothetical protein [Streptomyces sp. NPDC001933]|uniref:hypothetical protein n=1 Tax=Streptomyces sp. NPDC001933 TaxID=3364626 RepID=UPI0036BFE07A
MLRHTAQRAVLIGTTLAAMAVLGAGTASAASAQTASGACAGVFISNSVCYEDAVVPGVANAIPEGDSLTSPHTIISMSNDTSIGYCIQGNFPAFSLIPGQWVDFSDTDPIEVTSVTALPEGAVCVG